MNEFIELSKKTRYCYSPYSKINVVCELCTKKKGGKEQKYIGVNVENVSFSLTICAERTAFVAALSNGVQKDEFKNILLFTDSLPEIIPCGACLQFISEFVDDKFEIKTCGKNKKIRTYNIKDLLPQNFSF